MHTIREIFATEASNLKVTENDAKKYLKIKELDEETRSLFIESYGCVKSNTSPRAIYLRTPIKVVKETVNFGFFKVWSKSLSNHLRGCDEVFIIAATLGVGADRIVEKYMRFWKAKALMCDAISSALIEDFCDKLTNLLVAEKGMTARFSPGYGDFDISHQKVILEQLEADKRAGIVLTDGMMMVPSKSVTAIIGLKKW